MSTGDDTWISEAIVEFLKGPLYTHPLMGFIDDKCLVFTSEEENKLEYTLIHNEFKQVVDELLTSFLNELGVSPEEFFKVAESSKDKLTNFVVRTILTVDDFLLFKSMMVKRNIELTQQVLSAVDAMTAALSQASPGSAHGGPHTAGDEKDIDEQLQQALKLSQTIGEQTERYNKLQHLMRSYQLQDEDIAMAMAIAESLRDMAKSQAELADLEHAIALSLSLEAEQKRQAATTPASSSTSATNTNRTGTAATSASARNTATASKPHVGKRARREVFVQEAFPEPMTVSTGVGVPEPRPVVVSPLDPLNLGPNVAADKMSAVAAAAAAAASLIAAETSHAQGEGLKSLTSHASSSHGTSHDGGIVKLSSKPCSSLSDLPPVRSPVKGVGLAPAPTSAAPPSQPTLEPSIPETETSELCSTASRDSASSWSKTGTRARAAGFKSASIPAGADLASIREAATAAAATQKTLLASQGNTHTNEAAMSWLHDAKKQLIAQKKAEREVEMKAYQDKQKGGKAAAGSSGGDKLPPYVNPGAAEMDAKRAALRDKLAQKFKADLLSQHQS